MALQQWVIAYYFPRSLPQPPLAASATPILSNCLITQTVSICVAGERKRRARLHNRHATFLLMTLTQPRNTQFLVNKSQSLAIDKLDLSFFWWADERMGTADVFRGSSIESWCRLVVSSKCSLPPTITFRPTNLPYPSVFWEYIFIYFFNVALFHVSLGKKFKKKSVTRIDGTMYSSRPLLRM